MEYLNDDIQQHLLKASIFRIGVVSSVDGRTVTIQVDRDKNLSHLLYKGELLNNVSVGSYIKILKGFDCLVGKIEREYIKEVPLQGDYAAPNDMVARFLIVQIVGYFKEGKYAKGVKELPLIGNQCLILEQNEYQRIHNFTSSDEYSIRLGHLMTDESISIDVSVNRLFASHIGIFGNTGSGKSYTLASLYKGLFEKFHQNEAFKQNARFLLFDFNGEYATGSSITKLKEVYNLSTQTDKGDKIILSPNDILNPELFFILASATEKTQQPFIRRVLKLYQKVQNEDDPISYTKGILRNQLSRILSMADLVLGDQLLSYMEGVLSHEEDLTTEISRHSLQKCFYVSIGGKNYYFNNEDHTQVVKETKIYQAIDTLTEDNEFISWITKFMYIQLIDDILANRAQNDHIAPAINKLISLSKDFSKIVSIPTGQEDPSSTDENDPNLTGKKGASLWNNKFPLVVVNLDKVNTSMKKLLPLLLSHKCYQEQKEIKESTVSKSMNIIIDEAHNILSYESTRESESWKDFRLETFEEIIKEGRKFGVFLTIASQRPSDISSTIISQLHNYLIHRLVNNRDLEMVEKAISYLDKLSVETLPILPAGACVLSGIIADLPVIVQVEKLNDEVAPRSQTIQLTKTWLDAPTP